MTYPPGRPSGYPPPQPPATGAQPVPPGYPPQQPYPQPPYPRQPYPGQSAGPGGGTAITASILLSLGCVGILLSLYSTIRYFAISHYVPGLILVQDIVATLAGILVIVATIMIWARQPVGRLLAIIGLSVILALDVYNFARPVFWHLVAFQPIGLLEIALNVASLVLVCLPSTGAYLKARRTPPSAPVPPAYPPPRW